MLARKCDRCGTLYEHYAGKNLFEGDEEANGVVLVDRNLKQQYFEGITYDLCPKCMVGLIHFLKDHNPKGDSNGN